MNAAEVSGYKLLVIDLDAKRSLKEGNDIENTERIHDTGFQKLSIISSIALSRCRKFVEDERPDLRLYDAIAAYDCHPLSPSTASESLFFSLPSQKQSQF
jgi:hypothetical protein